MAANKSVQIGSVIVSERNGQKQISIGLGRKGKKSQYDVTIELVAKDFTGKIIATQTDGFLNLVDPRTRPDELLQLGLISEEKYSEMKASLQNIPEKIKYQVMLSSR